MSNPGPDHRAQAEENGVGEAEAAIEGSRGIRVILQRSAVLRATANHGGRGTE